MRAFFQRLFRIKKTQKHNRANQMLENSNYIAVTKKRSLTHKRSITPYAHLHGLKTKTKSARKRSDSGSYNKLFERGTDTQLNNKVKHD